MSTQARQKKTKRILVTFSIEEYEQLFQAYAHSPSSNLCAYIRTILTNGSMTVSYRNLSTDELIHEMVGIKEVLWKIRTLFSQQLQSFYQASTNSELEAWIRVQEKNKRLFFDKTEELRQLMIKKYDRCKPS